MKTLRVLIVDDDDIGDLMRIKLSREAPHFLITALKSGRECLKYIHSNDVDCILSDYQMPGMSGMQLLKELNGSGKDIPFIFVTGQGNEEVAREAFKNGAYDYFTKDIGGFAHFPRIINSVEQAVKHREAERSKARAEAALLDEKNKLEAIIASMGDGISIQGTDFRVLYQNQVQKDLFGDHLGGYCYEVYENSDRVCDNCPVAASFKDGKVHRVEKRAQSNKGELQLEITASALRDSTGRIVAGIEVVRDVTERKLAEDALRESEKRYRVLFNKGNDALVVHQLTEEWKIGRFIEVNDVALQKLGYTREEFLELSPLDIDIAVTPEIYASLIEEFKIKGHVLYETTILAKDGRKIDFEVNAHVFELNGRQTVLAVARDITTRKQAEEEKARLESIAEAVNTMNNIGYIFSGIRHEIGSPVNSLKMTLSILRDNIAMYSKARLKDYLERSLAEIAKVEYLLNSLKNFNMYESPRRANVDFGPFMEKFLSLITGDLMKKGIMLDITVDPAVRYVFADPRALQQVMLNLITNASDALDGIAKPLISIRACKTRDMVTVRISDNGCGISEEQQKNLFKPFHTSKPSGTGLGLVIARKMLTKMNGTIYVSSRKGLGTTVEITIPEGLVENA